MAFGSIADILFQWESIGFFDIVLPFLLVFAIVFGILSYMGIFGNNKGINAILAIILGLLSVRAGFFQAFLAEVAPRLGVGLTVLLVIMILFGLFVQDQSKKTIGWIMIGIAAVIFIIIISQMYTIFNYFGSGLGLSNPEIIGWIIMVGLLIVIVIVVAIGNSEKDNKHKGIFVPWYGKNQ
jgi:hypothetical protein